MKKTYHICISAGDEVLCRSEEDYIFCFNALALAINNTDSSLLADSIMSTHIHECIRTSDLALLIKKQKYTYTRYFNRKYRRKGSLCESPFIIELDGLYHTLAALSYVFRNALHHGISPTPFGYRHSTARVIFKEALGYHTPETLMPKAKHHKFLPYRIKCPKGYRMDINGLILREDVADTTDVEHMFGTARSFLYYMNRISGEEWAREQEKDERGKNPITLNIIENGINDNTTSQMLMNEHGRNDYKKMNDIALCTHIDNEILPGVGKESVYQLTDREKDRIARHLYAKFHVSEAQIRRCLAVSYQK